MSSLDTRKRTRLLPVAGLVILIVTIGIVLFSGAAGMSRAGIEQRLQQFSGHITEEAARRGKEAHFNYGTITMEGWGFNKRALVDDVSLALSEKSLLDTSRWTLSTAQMQIEPDSALPNNLTFVFAQPVNFIENSQLRTIVTFATPLKYSYFDGIMNHKHTIDHVLHFPAKITLSPGQSAGDAPDKAGNTVISYDENPVFHITFRPEDNEREANYEFHNIKVASDDGTQAMIASLTSHMGEKPGSDGRPMGNYKVMLVDLTLRDGDKATKAYTINADADYTGDMPVLGLSRATPTGGASDMTLKQLLIATDNFKIKADGKLVGLPDDPLPSGMININVENVQQAIDSELVPEGARPAVRSALQRITGQPVASLTNITIPLKREKNGVFYIGNVTFEELTASVLSDMIKGAVQSTTPAPQAVPAPDANGEPAPTPPAAEPPVMLPDSGANGAPMPDSGAAKPAEPAQPSANQGSM